MTSTNDRITVATADNGGRGPDGRFRAGNKAARGNPIARKVSRLRATLIRTVTVADLRQVVAALVREARAGDVSAAALVLRYVIGPGEAMDLAHRVADLEQAAYQQESTNEP